MPETWSLELYYRWFGLVWLVDFGHGHRGCKFVPHLLHRTAVLSCTSFWNLFGSIVLHCFALFCMCRLTSEAQMAQRVHDMNLQIKPETWTWRHNRRQHQVQSDTLLSFFRRCQQAIEGRLQQTSLNRSGQRHAVLNAYHFVFGSSIHLASPIRDLAGFSLDETVFVTFFKWRRFVAVEQFFVSKAVPNEVKHFIACWHSNSVAYNVTRHSVRVCGCVQMMYVYIYTYIYLLDYIS